MESSVAIVPQVVLAAAGVGYLAVGHRALEHRDDPAGEPFVLLVVGAGLSGLVLSLPPLVGVESSLVLRSYAPLYLLPVVWVVFVLEYVGYPEVRSLPVVAVLAGPPVGGLAFNILAWGWPATGIVRALLSVGNVLALVALAYASGLAIGGLGLLLWTARRDEYGDRWTTVLLAVGGGGPWFLVVAGLQVHNQVAAGVLPSVAPSSILAVGFAGCALVIARATWHHRPFARVPAPGTVGPGTVFQQLSNPVVVLDRDERVARLNPAARTSFGDDGQDYVGDPLRDLLGTDLSTLQASPRLEVAVGGEPREFEYTVTTLTDQRGSTVGYAVLLYDITEREGRKQRIEELRRTRADLERKNERLDEFASVVSHDLRNPLAAAQARVQLSLDEEDGSHLPEAQDALDRMDQLLDELLSLARAGVEHGETSTIVLEPVVHGAWQTAETDGARLVVESDLPTVEADETTLRQTLENLFRNAAEHGVDPGKRTGTDHQLTVTVGPLPDGFYVADDGSGIPRTEGDRIFEHGFTTSDEGTGLGLSIVQEIVEAHGWEISVTASEAGGARFEITGATVDRG